MEMAAVRPTVAVIGASKDRSKFGNKAVRAFRAEGWDVFPIHPTFTEIEGIPAYPDLGAVPVEHLDRVSLYVPPVVGLRILEDVARKQVGEVWLNPGTESPEVLARAEALGLNIVQACSILDIGQSPGRY
jgi:predicted CoA-binding protein